MILQEVEYAAETTIPIAIHFGRNISVAAFAATDAAPKAPPTVSETAAAFPVVTGL